MALQPIAMLAQSGGKKWSIEDNLGGGTISQDDDYWEVNND